MLLDRTFSLLSDHPVRHIAQNLMCLLPGVPVLQKRRTATGVMNDPSVIAEWASLILKDCKQYLPQTENLKFLEIGPGHSLGVAVALLANTAASVSAIDVYKYADLTNLKQYDAVLAECKSTGLATAEANAPALLTRLNYVVLEKGGPWPIPDNAVDVVYSFFAGEHLKNPAAVLDEVARVLRPGGLSIFVIDLRDHIHVNGNWLQFLYYEDWLWNAMASNRGSWSNRLLSPEWKQLFEGRFEMMRFDEGHAALHPSFDIERLAGRFRSFPASVLSVATLWVTGRKRDESGVHTADSSGRS